MLASKAGLGGFISTIAASMAESYVANSMDKTAEKPTKISETSRISFEHNGTGFSTVNTGFNQDELNDVINKIKSNIFSEALDNDISVTEVVESITLFSKH